MPQQLLGRCRCWGVAVPRKHPHSAPRASTLCCGAGGQTLPRRTCRHLTQHSTPRAVPRLSRPAVVLAVNKCENAAKADLQAAEFWSTGLEPFAVSAISGSGALASFSVVCCLLFVFGFFASQVFVCVPFRRACRERLWRAAHCFCVGSLAARGFECVVRPPCCGAWNWRLIARGFHARARRHRRRAPPRRRRRFCAVPSVCFCPHAGTGELMERLKEGLPEPPTLADAADVLAESETVSCECLARQRCWGRPFHPMRAAAACSGGWSACWGVRWCRRAR